VSNVSEFSEESFPDLVEVYDTTLRDGNQSVGVNFTSTQKLRVAKELVEAGVDYVEGGWPNETNPTDVEFFRMAKELDKSVFSHVTAFGMTRRPNTSPANDKNLEHLLKSRTGNVTIFGKSWLFQVEAILRTTPDENQRMIHDSVDFLVSRGRNVVYDAEHFFDGFKANSEYAVSTLSAAEDAGASMLVLCDTRGGSYPSEINEITKDVIGRVGVPVGIHAHNDRGMATANSLFAVLAGASHVQGTMNGFGERVGNADLIEVVANLHLMGIRTKLQPSELTYLSRFACEMSGLRENPFKPFVGKHAFAHKGGVHGDAVLKAKEAYEFCDPAAFGNARTITISSQAGRSSLLSAARKLGFKLSKHDSRVGALLREVKCLEASGCSLELAEASLELLFLRALTPTRDPFRLLDWEASVQSNSGKSSARCTLSVDVGQRVVKTRANGNGPVNALDRALQLVLKKSFGSRLSARLIGYRVREIDSQAATAARVAVYIDFADGRRTWTTVASSTNIIKASVDALVDGYAYALRRSARVKKSRVSTKSILIEAVTRVDKG
jgi:2-isopropylmalate synthase